MPASAQVALDNQVFREVASTAADGKTSTKLVPAKSLPPRATVVYVMTYRNNGPKPAANLVIDNKVPPSVIFAGAYQNSPAPQVSTDGGLTYGVLSAMKVRDSSGAQRAAQFSDVTHVRWIVAGPVAPQTSGSVGYKGRVR